MPLFEERVVPADQLSVPDTSVVVAYPTSGNPRVEFHQSMLMAVLYDKAQGWSNIIGERHALSPGGQVAKGRNELAHEFLTETDAEWLWFVDDDMVVKPETLPTLLIGAQASGAKVMSALCVVVGKDGPIPTIYQLGDPTKGEITRMMFDYIDGVVSSMAACGAGCLLIHRSVLEGMAAAAPGRRYPWFADGEMAEQWVGEDVSFGLKANRLGFPVYVHCGAHVGHVKGNRTWWPEDIKARRGFPDPKTYVVIPTKDRLDLLAPLVHQLRRESDLIEQIVVVDNGSGTKTKNWLGSQDDVFVIDAPGVGINRMWNLGIEHALTDSRQLRNVNIVVLNNDLVLGRSFIRRLVEALRSEPNLIAVSGNYDGRDFDGLVQPTTDICAGRMDGTGGFAGFAFAITGEWCGSGYRFPEECMWWYGDNDLVLAAQASGVGKVGIARDATVTHIDGGGQSAGDVGWSKYREQTDRDRVAFEERWRRIADAQQRAAGPPAHTPTEDARVCVLSANFGGHDNVSPLPAQDIDCDAILLSDVPCEVPGWRNVVAEIPDGVTPRMFAKRPRCRPQDHTDAEVVVWLDGHLEVRSGSLVRELVDQLGDGAIGAFRHGFHTAISEEAALASTLPKYAGYDLAGQAKHYLAEGHPDTWGLWTTGVMVRRPAATVELGDAWLDEIERWGPEDQISLPYALRTTGTEMADLPFEGWWEGTRFALHAHNDGTM